VDVSFHAILHANREQEREYEQPDGVTNDVDAQQCRGDYSRRHLAAGDLKSDQQRAERKNQKGQCCCDSRLQQGLGALHAETQKRPLQAQIQPMSEPGRKHRKRYGDYGNDPERRSYRLADLIKFLPEHLPLRESRSMRGRPARSLIQVKLPGYLPN